MEMLGGGLGCPPMFIDRTVNKGHFLRGGGGLSGVGPPLDNKQEC